LREYLSSSEKPVLLVWSPNTSSFKAATHNKLKFVSFTYIHQKVFSGNGTAASLHTSDFKEVMLVQRKSK
jgi:hypothetical protein